MSTMSVTKVGTAVSYKFEPSVSRAQAEAMIESHKAREAGQPPAGVIGADVAHTAGPRSLRDTIKAELENLRHPFRKELESLDSSGNAQEAVGYSYDDAAFLALDANGAEFSAEFRAFLAAAMTTQGGIFADATVRTAMVTRAKQYKTPGKNSRFAWRWTYSLRIPGEPPIGAGDLAEVAQAAKAHGAERVVRVWS